MPVTRQRGFYSEILDSEMDAGAAGQLLDAASLGPVELEMQPHLAAPKQKVPAAAQFGGLGEEALVDYYLEALASRRGGGGAAPYPRDAALRHYRLAICDYGRFVMGRFWRDATPASFAANAAKPNVVLANRNLASALRFVERISECLGAVEAEMAVAS